MSSYVENIANITVPVSVDLNGAVSKTQDFKLPYACKVVGMGAMVTETVVATSTAPVMSVKVGSVEHSTLTVPNTTAAGTSVTADSTDAQSRLVIPKGTAIEVHLKTTGLGGVTAGLAFANVSIEKA